MSLTRRQLLQTSTTVLAGSKLLAGVEDYFRPAGPVSAEPQKIVTACGVCSPNCGMIATVKDGVAVFLEGLPGDLSGKGHLCGKGASSLQLLYDPDRLKYPLKRTNPRKGLDQDPGWVRISWQEALDEIGRRFKGYLDTYGAESLLFISREAHPFFARLWNAIGAVNVVNHIDECYSTDTVIMRWTVGGKTMINDVSASKYILSLGWDIPSRGKMPAVQSLVEAKENGAKLVCFNPERSITARMADEWYPIKPGTDLAVALAMIHVILNENLFDREFVDNYTNFRDYEANIRNHFARFTPEWAEKESDVPADAIRRIAREFAATKPAVAPCHKKTPIANYMNSTQTAFAISILNILVGGMDRLGGRYFARSVSIPSLDAIYPPPKPYPQVKGRRVDGRDKLPLVHAVNQGMFSTLADGMLNKYPGMIKGCFIFGYTIQSFPEPLKIADALSQVDFTVVVDTLPTDTTLLADIVLPSTMFLEGSALVTRVFRAPYQQVVVRQPVVNALFETRSAGWLGLELGKRLAPDYFKDSSGAWLSTSALLDEQAKRAGIANSFADFRKMGIYERKAAFTPRTTFNVPGGKCQIYVPQFEKDGEPLPNWYPKAELPNAQYPYYLLTFIPIVHNRNSTQNNAILHEMYPTNEVFLNPQTAARHGIKDGDMVRIRSRVGDIRLPAKLTERIRPDCVMVPHGFGHRSRALRLAAGKGERDADLIPARTIEELIAAKNFGGSGCMMDAVVRIDKV